MNRPFIYEKMTLSLPMIKGAACFCETRIFTIFVIGKTRYFTSWMPVSMMVVLQIFAEFLK